MSETRDETFVNASNEPFHIRITGPAGFQGSVLFCVHGAGLSGDCFTQLANFLQSSAEVSAAPPALASMAADVAVPSSSGKPSAAVHPIVVVTYDLRCHGTSTYAGGEESLTLERLVSDFKEVLRYTKETLLPGRPYYVLGHSLGGSIVAHGLSGDAPLSEGVAGVILVEVVEGTAKLSLSYMNDFLRKRPHTFATVKDAEAWFLTHGGMHSPEGAAVSVPPLLKQRAEDSRWEWRTNLEKLSGVWNGWFDGVDSAFISFSVPKMLCVANSERLDTSLTIAQMQGKFQYEIIGNGCGHYVMDDATGVFGTKVRSFISRIEKLRDILKGKNAQISHLNNTTVPPNRM